MIVMYGRKLSKEKKNFKPKVGVNLAMVECDQPVVDVYVTIRGQKTRMPKVDMPTKKLLEKEVNLGTKGR
jgi:hypothetical protein